jgi:hypothetical protein
MFHDALIALIRTFVPSAVGTVVAWAAARGIAVDAETSAALAAALVAVCTSVYYAGVTYLERKVNPAFGWLLGAPKAPSYEPTLPPVVVVEDKIAVEPYPDAVDES